MTKDNLTQVNLESLAPLYPVDRVATRVIGRGEQPPAIRPQSTRAHSDVPFPFHTPDSRQLNDPMFTDLTGRKFGRLTVLGIAELRTKGTAGKRGINWVVRCVCGNYEMRKSKYIKQCLNGNESALEAKCEWCDLNDRMRKRVGRFEK